MNRLVIHIILVFLLWNNSMAQSDTAIVKTTIDSIFNNKNILSECVIAVERYRPFDNINARNQDFNKFFKKNCHFKSNRMAVGGVLQLCR